MVSNHESDDESIVDESTPQVKGLFLANWSLARLRNVENILLTTIKLPHEHYVTTISTAIHSD